MTMSTSRGETFNMDSSLVSSTHSDSALFSSSFFVGSPDALNTQNQNEQRTIRATPSLGSHSRPAIERSLSLHYQRRTSSSTTGQPNSHYGSVSIPTPNRPRMHQHQWSLFGQRMENEGQLTGSGLDTPSGHSRFSRRPSWSSSAIPPSMRTRSSAVLIAGDSSDAETEDTDIPTTRATTTNLRLPTLPVLWKNILKCSVAYFLASLFTLHPYLSNFFGDLTSYGDYSGPSPSGHMIATMYAATPVFF